MSSITDLMNVIFGEIETGTDAKREEAEDVRGQTETLRTMGEGVFRAEDQLIDESANFTESEKERLRRQRDVDVATIDAAESARQQSNDLIEDVRDSIHANAEDISFVDEQEARLNQISRGIDPDTGEEMNPFQKAMAMLSAPGRMFKRAGLADQKTRELREMMASQQALQVAYQQLEADAQYDPQYLDAQRQLADATMFANINEVSLAQKRDIYNIAKEKYGIEANNLDSMVKAANQFDETEKAQLLMQMVGLQLQSDQLSFAQQDEARQKHYFNMLQKYSTNAGLELDEDTLRVAADRYFRNDLPGMIDLIGAGPKTVALIANMNKNLAMETAVAGGIDVASVMAQNAEDPKVKAQGVTYQEIYNNQRRRFEQDEQAQQQINNQLVNEGLMDSSSDEFKARRQELEKQFLEEKTAEQLQAAKDNSMGYLLNTGNLKTGVGPAIENYWRKQATTADGIENIDPQIHAASKGVASLIDRNSEAFNQAPGMMMNDLMREAARIVAGEDSVRTLTFQQQQLHAERAGEAVALVMRQLRDVNQMHFRNDPLFQDSNFDFTVDFDWRVAEGEQGSGLKGWLFGTDMRGKDLTDPNTFIFALKNSAFAGNGFFIIGK